MIDVQIKLPESDSGEGSEGSTEATRYSKQNTNVRNDNNIQHKVPLNCLRDQLPTKINVRSYQHR